MRELAREKNWPQLEKIKVVGTCSQCENTTCLELSNGTTNVNIAKEVNGWIYIKGHNEKRTIPNCPKLK